MLTVLSVLVSLYAAGVLGSSAPGVHKKETNGGFEVQNNGAWNYDYGHKAGSCPTTCDTTTKCGPECWTEVPGGVCDGLSQTPINVVQAGVNSDLSYPTLTTTNGGCTAWKQFTNDHAFEVSFSGCSNMTLDYMGKNYALAQFHFHTPSEHTIGGGYFDGEMHMVHVETGTETPALLVLGVMLAKNDLKANSFMDMFWDVADEYDTTVTSDVKYAYEYEVTGSAPISAYDQFLPGSRSFYTYSGSLTTHPCTEGVTWLLFADPLNVAQGDIEKIQGATANYAGSFGTITLPTLPAYNWDNYRPVQALNGRVVEKYEDGTSGTGNGNGGTVASTDDDADSPKVNGALGLSIAAMVLAVALLVAVCFIAFKPVNTAEPVSTVEMADQA